MLNSQKAKLWNPFSALPVLSSTSEGITSPSPFSPSFQVGSADKRPWQKIGVEDGKRQIIYSSVSGSTCRDGCFTFLVSVSARQIILSQLSGNRPRTLSHFLDFSKSASSGCIPDLGWLYRPVLLMPGLPQCPMLAFSAFPSRVCDHIIL